MSQAIVELKNVNIYQSSSLILSEVNISIDKGEFVYLVGKTGTGKSSLLKTLYGDLTLTEGEGTVVGYNLRELDWKKVPFLRRSLGVVFQDFQLLTDRNVNENLKFVLKATGWNSKVDIKNRVDSVLEKVGLINKRAILPNGLSGGEQQRLAIARALLNDPELIIADEPTGNLDPDSSNDIMKLLFEVANSNRAVLMVTHNYSIIDRFPARVIKIENGKLSELGTEVQKWASLS